MPLVLLENSINFPAYQCNNRLLSPSLPCHFLFGIPGKKETYYSALYQQSKKELLQEAHLQDSFDSATGSVDVKEFAENGVIHVYSNETGKDVAQIPLTRLSELEKEVKDFVEYKLSTYKVTNPTKRSDLISKSIYAFDIPDEIARVKRYKEYAEYCLKQLEQMQKEG